MKSIRCYIWTRGTHEKSLASYLHPSIYQVEQLAESGWELWNPSVHRSKRILKGSWYSVYNMIGHRSIEFGYIIHTLASALAMMEDGESKWKSGQKWTKLNMITDFGLGRSVLIHTWIGLTEFSDFCSNSNLVISTPWQNLCGDTRSDLLHEKKDDRASEINSNWRIIWSGHAYHDINNLQRDAICYWLEISSKVQSFESVIIYT